MRILPLLAVAVLLLARPLLAATFGGQQPLDPSADDVREAAQAAVDAFNVQSRSLTRHVLVDVLGGTKQVVAGMRYDLVVSLVPTDCLNDRPVPEGVKCAYNEANIKPLRAVVLSQPWNTPRFTVTFPEL